MRGTGRPARRRGETRRFTRGEARTVVCGAVFVALVALKLLLPAAMADVRATVGRWLTRDADFEAAFSAVGRAVSGEARALEDAYVAVFGAEEAREVSGAAEVALADEPSEPEPAAETRALPFDHAPPLHGAVTSAFGWRTHPVTGAETFHNGVDVAADEGADIAAFADGVVGVVAESVELGKYLTVHHADGYLTLYAHCSRVTAASGSAVRRGDKIAEVGQTGNATGPHLHFELQDGEDCVDPAPYL